MRTWVYDPHSGGVKIPPKVRERTEQRIRAYAEANYAGKFTRLAIRFHGAFCYIDAYREPEPPPAAFLRTVGETRVQFLERVRSVPVRLCRLRYLGDEEAWSLAFYAYSSEAYEPSAFPNGELQGTPEDGFAVGAVYLKG